MTWASRSMEERNLLNPSFCSILIWHAAHGYQTEGDFEPAGMPLELTSLLLPILLHRPTLGLLPRTARTSLAVWLEREPLLRGQLVQRAQLLVPHTKDALVFGGRYNALIFAE